MSRTQMMELFLIDAFDMKHAVSVAIVSEEVHATISGGRHSIYYDRGVVPFSPDEEDVLVAAFCGPQILRETETWTDEEFHAYLTYWTMRLKMRFTHQIELGSVAMERAPEEIVEEMVEAQMLAAGLDRWWERRIQN